MGFRQANIYIKGLATTLGIDEDKLTEAIKKSLMGGYARIWSIQNEGKYSLAKISTSKKNTLDDGSVQYDTDFQDGYVRLIGAAHEKAQELDIPTDPQGKSLGVSVQITACEVTNSYNAEKQQSYTNFAIFAFDVLEGKGAKNRKSENAKVSKPIKPNAKKSITPDEDDDLPFN